MFVVTLKFTANKAKAAAFMQGHKDWLQHGFDSGIFLLAGSLQPNLGGAILAHNASRQDLDAIVAQDPFVAENIVVADILEITPSRQDARLQFLAA